MFANRSLENDILTLQVNKATLLVRCCARGQDTTIPNLSCKQPQDETYALLRKPIVRKLFAPEKMI